MYVTIYASLFITTENISEVHFTTSSITLS